MFDSKHYIPILRWKAAEKEALKELAQDKKTLITPLIEILMPQNEDSLDEAIKELKKTIPKIPKDILEFWGQAPIFIDFGLIDSSLRTWALTETMSAAKDLGLSIIPVINLNSDTGLQKIAAELAKKNIGLCLRLYRSDFKRPNLGSDINNFLSGNTLSKKETDLLADFQITDGECNNLTGLISLIPNISDWRTFTFASGAFPQDLTNFSVDKHTIDRADWNSWFKQITGKQLVRKPAFGDYIIQYPIYKEPVRGSNPSASIRYTLNEQWLIMRGQGLRSAKSAGHAQYPAHAKLLTEMSEFFGADFSPGDLYIAEKGKDIHTKQTGTPRTWLRAGINHHLTCTAVQIANLP